MRDVFPLDPSSGQLINPEQNLERVFPNLGAGPENPVGDPDEILSFEHRVRMMIEDSVSYEEEYLADARQENQAYYYGLLPALDTADEGEEQEPINKSSFVSTDVRDTVLTIMPSLMRIFTGNEHVADFIPHLEAEQPTADQMHDTFEHVLMHENEGFLLLHSVFKDALTVKAGFVKWRTDMSTTMEEQQFLNVSDVQLSFLTQERPDVQIVEHNQNENGLLNVTLRYKQDKPRVVIEAVPPDEARISRFAKSAKKSDLIGHEYTAKLSDLVKRGYDKDQLAGFLSTTPNYSDERYLRNPGLTQDQAMETGIAFGEWYIWADSDGDGIDELHYIETIGSGRQISYDQIVSSPNMAIFCGDPTPHTAIGDCIADITKDIQKFKTNMMRGQLDNLAESMNPRTVVNELTTNIEDVLNDEVGAVIRTRGDPNAAVAFNKTPYVGADVQQSIDYLDQVRASRTGITEASKGLDPKAMQSTAMVGIDAIVSGAQERIELIARILAETGMKDMMVGVIKELINNPNPQMSFKLRGTWKTVNPSTFDPTYRVEVNPTLGKGSDMIRLQALTDVATKQEMIMAKFGIKNPVVTPVEYLNTMTDILALVNIKNPGRYFKPIDPNTWAQIVAQPEQPDPTVILAQAEVEKVKAQTAKEVVKAQQADQRTALDIRKLQTDDQFRRDKLIVDSTVKLADIMLDPKAQTNTPATTTPDPNIVKQANE